MWELDHKEHWAPKNWCFQTVYWRQKEKRAAEDEWLDSITDSRTWISANSGRWWRKGKAGVLQSMGSQTVWHDLATEQQQIIKKIKNNFKTVHQFSSVTQPCLTLCHPMNHSTQGLTVHHQLHEFTQTHVHWVNDVIQPSHPLLSPSPAPNPSQH